jgi:hypothetical protein
MVTPMSTEDPSAQDSVSGGWCERAAKTKLSRVGWRGAYVVDRSSLVTTAMSSVHVICFFDVLVQQDVRVTMPAQST